MHYYDLAYCWRFSTSEGSLVCAMCTQVLSLSPLFEKSLTFDPIPQDQEGVFFNFLWVLSLHTFLQHVIAFSHLISSRGHFIRDRLTELFPLMNRNGPSKVFGLTHALMDEVNEAETSGWVCGMGTEM